MSITDWVNALMAVAGVVAGYFVTIISDSVAKVLLIAVIVLAVAVLLLWRHINTLSSRIRSQANEYNAYVERRDQEAAALRNERDEARVGSIKALRMVAGDGFFQGTDVVVLENPGDVRDHALLTLHCGSSGAEQPIAFLQVVQSTKGSDLICVTYPSTADAGALAMYFNDQSKRESLRAIPSVVATELASALSKARDAAGKE